MNGVILVNKEKGWTSNDIVQKLKHTFNEKTGHTGTLDPLATGILPILIGKGTSLSKYLIKHDKEYISTIKLGKKTSTGDSEGEILEEKSVPNNIFKEEYVKEILQSFIGEQKQIPPMYSAIKINGKKLYEYARKGQTVEIKPRQIEIYNIQLISISEKTQEIKYKVNCSKGTYIRTLTEDIALKLGTVGFMKDLQRTKVGDFNIEQSVKINEIILNFKDPIWLENNFITLEKFFKHKDSIILEKDKLKMFLNGVKLHIENKNEIYKIYDKNRVFIGIGIVEDKNLKRDICENYNVQL